MSLEDKPRSGQPSVINEDMLQMHKNREVAQNRFKRFQSSNFDDKDEPCSGRPLMNKVDAIKEKVEQDRQNNQFGSLLPAADETQARRSDEKAGIVQQKGCGFHHDNARSATQNRLREFGSSTLWLVCIGALSKANFTNAIAASATESLTCFEARDIWLISIKLKADRLNSAVVRIEPDAFWSETKS
ncbi:hypothetical protein EVAR_101175_1 [Eumeta japonica]|uniref:Uncharacterized protein n=1 Tax=Eumeta variegata TaxID=151549 RepID=A0A4C1SIV3_EUMVA|nr:hypothetical protein EVAR_101175_1 [Eumeta japonica]